MATLSINSFEKGIHQERDKMVISFDMAQEARNCVIDDGSLKRCSGVSQYSSAPLGSPINTIMKYFSNNVGSIIASTENTVYKLTNNTWSQIATGFTSGSFDYLNYQKETTDIMIFGNGNDNVKVYDGSTVRDLKNRAPIHDINGNISYWLDGDGGQVSNETSCDAKAPKCKFIELHKERLWMSGNSESPNSLYFSAPYDPDDWIAPTNEEDVNMHGGEVLIPTWDGGSIIGLKALFDDIVVFKNKNVFRIFGTYPGNYTMIQIFNTMNGNIIDKSIGAINNDAFWLTSEGLFNFDGNSVNPIHQLIQRFFDTINKSAINNSVATIYKDKYIVFVPTGTSTVCNAAIIYDTIQKSVMIRDGVDLSTAIEFNDKIIFSNNSGIVYVYDDGNKIGDLNINSYWTTGETIVNASNAIKTSEYVYFTGYGDGTVRISCITERATKYIDVLLDSSEKVYKKKLKNKGRKLSYKFENLDGCNFVIKQPQFIIELDYD